MSTCKKLQYAFIVFFACVPFHLHAQSQALTVTPPLFQISIEPGSVWQSSIKVANSNEFPLTVYAQVVNFAAEGEGGKGKFIPVLNKSESQGTFAEWIEISEGPHVIPEGQTGDISFFVDVPHDAAPGGHFAAILIETKPPDDTNAEVFSVGTSQAVASLFFARVEGDVIESADIREFSVTERIVEIPDAEFSLRFENKGNVHVQPRGNIVIKNMWGTERGVIPVNNKTHYGNVLPGTIRDFRFTWKGEQSVADIGRYSAEAMLTYGDDDIKSATSVTYFWVVPLKATVIVLTTLISLIWFITFAVRAYIRRMLTLAGVDVETLDKPHEAMSVRASDDAVNDVHLTSYKIVTKPLRDGAQDFSKRLRSVHEFFGVIRMITEFVWHYKLFFVTLLILVTAFVLGVAYVSEVSERGKAYEVTIDEGDATMVITGETSTK